MKKQSLWLCAQVGPLRLILQESTSQKAKGNIFNEVTNSLWLPFGSRSGSPNPSALFPAAASERRKVQKQEKRNKKHLSPPSRHDFRFPANPTTAHVHAVLPSNLPQTCVSPCRTMSMMLRGRCCGNGKAARACLPLPCAPLCLPLYGRHVLLLPCSNAKVMQALCNYASCQTILGKGCQAAQGAWNLWPHGSWTSKLPCRSSKPEKKGVKEKMRSLRSC